MSINYSKLNQEFEDKGYFICRKIFSEDYVSELIDEIYSSNENIKYYDKDNKLRRIEKLYDKGQHLINANKKIIDIIKNILKKDVLIFKDKFNAKPPGGEGFYAHYDGIFKFKDDKDNIRNGWYEYGDFFVNALVALDECNKKNGTIELANAHNGNFNELLENTKKNGTPALTEEIEIKNNFNLINLNVGDVVFFSNTCPHRSKKNNSDVNRRIMYYTYSLTKYGSKYNEYFEDKQKSKNPLKALNSNK